MTQRDDGERAARALAGLMELVRRLRAPDGCPWDREQTTRSVAPYILEEAYEAVEAVESGDVGEAMAELGDLLFQVVFMANLYAEAGQFDLAQVIERVTAKMTRRHPHVFGEVKVNNAQEVKGLWGEIKSAERKDDEAGLLDSVPLASPALIRAHRLGQRAARVDFDWPDADQVLKKIQEETGELMEAVNPEQAEAELGDLLFSWVQWARHKGLGSEQALRGANNRFTKRFQAMESLAKSREQSLAEMDMTQMDELWEEVKHAQAKNDAKSNEE
jgi:MazG family protein